MFLNKQYNTIHYKTESTSTPHPMEPEQPKPSKGLPCVCTSFDAILAQIRPVFLCPLHRVGLAANRPGLSRTHSRAHRRCAIRVPLVA